MKSKPHEYTTRLIRDHGCWRKLWLCYDSIVKLGPLCATKEAARRTKK